MDELSFQVLARFTGRMASQRVARSWLNDRRAKNKILDALTRGYRNNGIRGLLAMAYKVEAREAPFDAIKEPHKLLSDILQTIVRDRQIRDFPVALSKSDKMSLLSYRDDLRELSGDRSLSPY
jgi:hypothetical protein